MNLGTDSEAILLVRKCQSLETNLRAPSLKLSERNNSYPRLAKFRVVVCGGSPCSAHHHQGPARAASVGHSSSCMRARCCLLTWLGLAQLQTSPPNEKIMSRGPLPSEICLLSSLPDRQVGDKVRFLGWYVAVERAALLTSLPVLIVRTASQHTRRRQRLYGWDTCIPKAQMSWCL